MNTVVQRSFASGEVAPALYARCDQARYATGLRTMRNFLTKREGGAQNRPGTTYVARIKNTGFPARLIPFVISSNPAISFILEFGDQYMRVHQLGQQVLVSSKNITGVTQANPAVVTAPAHGRSNGDEIAIFPGLGMDQLLGRNYIVANATTDTFTLKDLDGNAINSTAFNAYVSGGTVAKVYEIATPYGWADLSGIKYAQSNNVLTLVHPLYAPRKLTYDGSTPWVLSSYSFAPSIGAPTSLNAIGGAASSDTTNYAVTAVGINGEESLVSNIVILSGRTPSSTGIVSLSWTAPVGVNVSYYNVYRYTTAAGVPYTGGQYCLFGVTNATSYIDDGHAADLSAQPPVSVNPFGSAGNYPSTCAYYQQRLIFANTLNNPQTFWASVSGDYTNFSTHILTEDDDAITCTINGQRNSPIKNMLDLHSLLLLTADDEKAATGDSNGVLTPSSASPVRQSGNGSSDLQPILVSDSALYAQGRGSIVRDIGFEIIVNGYRGNDLTVFSTHLFDNYYLVDWAYQKHPNYNVWIVRSDGGLLGLTYIKEQQMVSWHRHDTDGTFESVVSVPENFNNNEDGVYFIVNRRVNNQHVRYVERMASRQVVDNVHYCFMDAARTNVGSTVGLAATLTLTGGATWDYTETLTLSASGATFTQRDVGNEFLLIGSDGSQVRFLVQQYAGTTTVLGHAVANVPATLQGFGATTWKRMARIIYGLWHLEGKQVSVFGDGYVAASPNNSDYAPVTVANGSITLPQGYAEYYVGLPYISDLETLDIDSPQGEGLGFKKIMVNEVTIRVEKTRGIFVGPKAPEDDEDDDDDSVAADVDPLEGLTVLKLRRLEPYGSPVALKTRKVKQTIQSNWNSNGRVFLRQVDPLPASILSISPSGLIPLGGA